MLHSSSSRDTYSFSLLVSSQKSYQQDGGSSLRPHPSINSITPSFDDPILNSAATYVIVAPRVAPALLWRARRPSQISSVRHTLGSTTRSCTDSSGTAKDSAALPRSLMWQTSSILVRASPRFYILHLVSGALRPGPHLHPRQRWTTPVSPLTLRLWPHLHPSRCSCSACDSTYFALARAHGCRSVSHTPPLPIRLLGLNLFFLSRP
jgi:hypothetical protein